MRITEIRVLVAKIWQKEFWGAICNFWNVARAISRNIFKFWGSVLKFVDCGLISGKGRASLKRWLELLVLELFSNRKSCGLGSPTQGPVEALAHAEPRTD
jgi:hypothetical protein